jgi:hypothetical protein
MKNKEKQKSILINIMKEDEKLGLYNTQNIFHFELGFSAKEKQIKDKLNHLKSDLRDVLQVKLTKVINTEKASILRAQIEILERLL